MKPGQRDPKGLPRRESFSERVVARSRLLAPLLAPSSSYCSPSSPARHHLLLVWDDFRKYYKEANPDSKGVKTVAKEGGEKWKSMTDEEKKPYVDKAAELKQEYKRALESDIAGDGDVRLIHCSR